MTDFSLIRHGQTDWNLTGRWQGQAADAPGLNATGFAQAKALPAQLSCIRFSAIYSSDLLRARQTADALTEPLGLPVIIEPRLREINLGLWEGMLSSDIEARYPLELSERLRDPIHGRAPQGESVAEVAVRVLNTVKDIVSTHPDEQVIVVGHGVTLAIIICHTQGIPLEQVYEHIPENARPYHTSDVKSEVNLKNLDIDSEIRKQDTA